MKFKKIILVTLMLLMILTIGSVSASDENITDELTVNDDLEMSSPVVDDVVDISQDDLLEKSDINWEIDAPTKIVNDSEVEVPPSISVNNFPWYDASGNYDLYIDDIKVASESYEDFELLPYLDHYGTYNWKVQYDGDSKYNPISANGTFVFVEYLKKVPDFDIKIPKRLATFSMEDDLNIAIENYDFVPFKLFIDGKKVADTDDLSLNINPKNLKLANGIHTWELKFDGNNHFLPYYKNGTFMYSNVYIVAEERYIEGETWQNVIKIGIENNIGFIKLLIDGNQVFYGPFKYDEEGIDELMCIDLPENLDYGMHTWKVIYEKTKGATTYQEEGKFDLTYINLNYEENYFVYGQDNLVTLSLPYDISGTVEIVSGGKSYKKAASEYNEFLIKATELDKQNIVVNVESTNKLYPSKTDVVSVDVRTEIYAPETVNFDEDYIVSLVLPSDAVGTLKIYVDDEVVKEEKLVNGIATINLGKLEIGFFKSICVSYEDGNYHVNTVWRDITATPKISYPTRMYVGEDKYITFELPKTADGTLKVKIDGSEVSTNFKNGKASIPLSKYDDIWFGVKISYYGDSNIANYETEFDINIKKYTPIITYVLPNTINVGQKFIITFNLPSDAEGSFSCEYNDDYYDCDVSKGKASLSIVPNKAGRQKIYYSFYSSGDKYGEVLDKSITFTANYVGKIEASTKSMVFTDGSAFKVRVFDKDNKPVAAGQTVTFKISGSVVATVKTDANGYASFKPKKNPGSYNVVISSNGLSVTKKLTVKHIVSLKTCIFKKSAKKLVLTATLAKINKKVLKNKKVTFKFNGKKYTAKTNSKGVAKVTIKYSVLKKIKVGKKVTYQATYGKDTVKKVTWKGFQPGGA